MKPEFSHQSPVDGHAVAAITIEAVPQDAVMEPVPSMSLIDFPQELTPARMEQATGSVRMLKADRPPRVGSRLSEEEKRDLAAITERRLDEIRKEFSNMDSTSTPLETLPALK
jgi:hypothetical protein